MNCECIADCLAAKLLLWAIGPWGTISDMKGLRRARPLVKDVLGEMPPAIVARFCLAFMSPSVGRMDTITSLELAYASLACSPLASRGGRPRDDTRAPERRRTGVLFTGRDPISSSMRSPDASKALPDIEYVYDGGVRPDRG